MIKNNSDILFMYDVTMANANGDPDQENRPRMDYDTKTMLVSDSRLKRNVRDFLAQKGIDIFVGTLNDKKVTMETMFKEVIKSRNLDKASPEEKEQAIIDNYADIRMFGSAMAVEGTSKTYTGAIQIGWGYSLHPVDIVKSNTIVTIMNDDNSTFGKMYKAHYGLMAHNITVNKYNAAKTSLTEKDKDIFSRALIQSLMNNVTQSKQGQQPLLYLEVVYADDFDGYMGDMRRFLQTEYNQCVRSLNDITVDFSKLSEAIEDMKAKGYIKEVLLWTSPFDKGFKNLPNATAIDLFKPVTE